MDPGCLPRPARARGANTEDLSGEYWWAEESESDLTDSASSRIFGDKILHGMKDIQRAQERENSFWVDALCIDRSDAHQRTHQTGVMSKVFGEPDHRFTWSGRAYDNSELAMIEPKAVRPENGSIVTERGNHGLPSMPSEATITHQEPRNASQFRRCSEWMFRHSAVRHAANKSDTKEGASKESPETSMGSRFNETDRVRPTWTASRLIAKIVILAAVPVCQLIVIRYGHSHGLLQLPGSPRVSAGGSCTHQAKFASQTPWLDCPNSLLLLAASMTGGSLLLSYHQLNAADDFQTRILSAFVCVGMAIGLCSGRTVLATALSILPWAIYAGLAFSDLWHVRRNWKMLRGVDKDGKTNGDEWADTVGEKV